MISQFIDSISNELASEWHLLVDGGSIDHGMVYYCLVLNLHADPFRKKGCRIFSPQKLFKCGIKYNLQSLDAFAFCSKASKHCINHTPLRTCFLV